MTTVILISYVLLGAGSAAFVVVHRRQVAQYKGASAALVMLVFWPFLLPGAVTSGEPVPVAPPPSGPRSEHGVRIDALAGQMHALFGVAGAETNPRERSILDAFVARVRSAEARVREMDEGLKAAPPGVRPRLEEICTNAKADLSHSTDLLEEVVGHLTLLRFARLADAEASRGEKARVETLLTKMEALVDLGRGTEAQNSEPI